MGECLQKLVEVLGSSPGPGAEGGWSAQERGHLISCTQFCQEANPDGGIERMTDLKQGMYQEGRIRPISSGAQHIWLMQGIACCHVVVVVQKVKIPIKAAIKRYSANST